MSAGPRLNETQQDWNLGLEYNKYLQEVVSILESDPDFRTKLENAKVGHRSPQCFLIYVFLGFSTRLSQALQ